MKYRWMAIVLLFAVPALGAQSATRIRFHVTKLSSVAVSDEHSSGTKYTVEGYDVETETTYRGECKDIVFFDNQGKASMHNVCIVPQAAKEYTVKVFPTSFMFPCDTPDGECPSGDPNVTRYMYLAYAITDEEEKPRHKPTRARWSTGPSVLVVGFAATSSPAKPTCICRRRYFASISTARRSPSSPMRTACASTHQDQSGNRQFHIRSPLWFGAGAIAVFPATNTAMMRTRAAARCLAGPPVVAYRADPVSRSLCLVRA